MATDCTLISTPPSHLPLGLGPAGGAASEGGSAEDAADDLQVDLFGQGELEDCGAGSVAGEDALIARTVLVR